MSPTSNPQTVDDGLFTDKNFCYMFEDYRETEKWQMWSSK